LFSAAWLHLKLFYFGTHFAILGSGPKVKGQRRENAWRIIEYGKHFLFGSDA